MRPSSELGGPLGPEYNHLKGYSAAAEMGLCAMTAEVENILRSFESLPEADKRQVASEIIRRSLKLHAPALSDEQLVSLAEGVFLELDRSEGNHG